MTQDLFKALSHASSDVLLGKVEHLVLSWTTSDGMVNTVYDKDDEASFLSMLGAIEMLKTRVLHGYANIPELYNDDDSEED